MFVRPASQAGTSHWHSYGDVDTRWVECCEVAHGQEVDGAVAVEAGGQEEGEHD